MNIVWEELESQVRRLRKEVIITLRLWQHGSYLVKKFEQQSLDHRRKLFYSCTCEARTLSSQVWVSCEVPGRFEMVEVDFSALAPIQKQVGLKFPSFVHEISMPLFSPHLLVSTEMDSVQIYLLLTKQTRHSSLKARRYFDLTRTLDENSSQIFRVPLQLKAFHSLKKIRPFDWSCLLGVPLEAVFFATSHSEYHSWLWSPFSVDVPLEKKKIKKIICT